ncbi:MAG: GNAT family N-acetyltransferase [Sphingobacteriales bacterium JAD_PAG50586_3]|nr:MAG: GNAT family N-acetyltransferase [Sphingobacteriales bacterium JAD_PAG50586_3]
MSLPVPHPSILSGDIVELRPLGKEHFAELDALAKEPRIWEFYTVNGGNSESLMKAMQSGLDDRDKGLQYPFVIYHKEHKKLIGGTRYLDIQALHNKLEIGWTWLHPDYWKTAVNLECKLLLLTFAFETLGVYRVQFKVDVLNMRSRKAVEKIGGIAEGILRNDMVRENGTKRNSVYFSIIDADWPETKGRLQARVQSKLQS